MTLGALAITALVLAAGTSSRMGKNKLLIEVDGLSLVEYPVDVALRSNCSSVVVIVGHDGGKLRACLADRPITIVENPNYAQGLASSLKAGIAAVPPNSAGAIVFLGDMPNIDTPLIDRMIAAFSPETGKEIVVPMRNGKRGNPVLWGKRFFPDLLTLDGDVGAKNLLGPNASFIADIDARDDSVLTDIDTPQALDVYLAAHKRRLSGS